ncbi:MAG: DegT/DnrJ/EryC1/StrS family aminotransferase [Pseudomonadota bacterium]
MAADIDTPQSAPQPVVAAIVTGTANAAGTAATAAATAATATATAPAAAARGGALADEVPFLPFALPDLGDEEVAEVLDCLRSGWITTGPRSKRFEADFAAYLGGGLEAIAVNSATAGLHLALEALGIGPGDEVIVPTLTFTATAEVVRYLGAHPVLVDIAPDTLNIDVAAVAAAITARTRAIIPVHFAGLACDMDPLLALAAQHKLHVVEDAAHAFPTVYKGALVGTLASAITVFSFYANKTMTTGEGGMVVTRDPQLAARIRLMRLHGISQDAFARYVSRTPAWFYEVVAPGFKYNLTDIAAAIGIQQLRKIDRFFERRQALAHSYTRALANLPLRLPAPAGPGASHAWHLYVVRVTAQARLGRDELIAKLSERGIGTSVHFIPLHRHPYWRDSYALAPAQFPVAEASYQAMLTLPLYTKMGDADQQRVIDAMQALLS